MEKVKRWWIIKALDSKGTVFRKGGKILFFNSSEKAWEHIHNECKDSYWLIVKLWKSKDKRIV